MKQFGRVAVLLGGRSNERPVSLKSGQAVLAALRSRGVDAHPFDPAERPLSDLVAEGFDRAFIALHGRGGEDGSMQGALEQLNIPYTGSGVAASAIAMDKWRTKMMWTQTGIPTAPYRMLDKDTDFDAVVHELGLPIMVKPVREGSSIGMSKVTRAEDLKAAWALAASRDPLVMAEAFVKGTELTAAVLGGEALPLIRLETPRVFYDYEAKYNSNETRYLCPSGIDTALEERVKGYALRAFATIGCEGWGRADVIIDEVGNPYFLEINTVPGMTDHSLVPMAAKASGIGFEDLCLRILEGAHLG